MTSRTSPFATRSTAERYSAQAFGRAAEALYRRVAEQKAPAGIS